MNLPRPQAVLFDLDGTLVDTAPDLAAAASAALAQRGLPGINADRLRSVVTSGARGMIRAAAPELTDDDTAATAQQLVQAYEANIAAHSALFEGMAAVLALLEAQKIRWGVVTNKFEHLAAQLLAALGLAGRCSVLVGGDTCAASKPAPDPLLHAATALSLPPAACWYVGDAHTDIQAARAAGMTAIAVQWGYGPYPSEGPDEGPADDDPQDGLADRPALHAWQPDAVFNTGHDLQVALSRCFNQTSPDHEA